MLTGEQFWNTMIETKNKCNHQCDSCEMYVSTKNKCLHDLFKSLYVWQKKKHNDLHKLISQSK